MTNTSKHSALGDRRWITADGRSMRWRDMTIDHLSNCYHLVRRQQGEVMLNLIVDQLTTQKRRVPKKMLISRIVAVLAAKRALDKDLRDYIGWRVEHGGK